MAEFRPSDFDWLADINKTQCYTTCDWARPAKSTDFGSNGYTASVTDWHELLQLTAPDPLCGIAFVRGGFPDTPDAILSRVQRRADDGSKGTFGAQLMPESEFELGRRRAQGLANFRWPYTQYELKRKSVRPGFVEVQAGTYELISFIKDDTLFQIIRIKPGKLSNTSLRDRYKENFLTRIQSRGISVGQPRTFRAPETGRTPGEERGRIDIKVGGTVRFGCPCSNGSPLGISDEENLVVETFNEKFQLNCSSARYLKRLEMQFFKNGQPLEMSPSEIGLQTGSPLEENVRRPVHKDVNASALQQVYLSNEVPTILICSFAIRNSTDPPVLSDMSTLNGIADYLGITSRSLEMTDRLWTACLTTNYGAAEAMELCATAKCTEQILGVSSVPVSKHEPNQAEAGASKSNGDQASEVALIHNIMTAQYVDLQSTFWQVRLLVKVHRYLFLLRFDSKLLEEDERESLTGIRTLYLLKLQSHLRSVLTWILKESLGAYELILPVAAGNYELLKELPNRSSCLINRGRINVDGTRNHICFATMALWYVMKHCPLAITADFKSRVLLSGLERVFTAGDLENSRGEKESTPKNDVLQWYFWSCLSLICQEAFAQSRGGQVPTGYTESGFSRQKIARSQEFCEKIVKRMRKSQSGPYSLEDEEVDRLSLLGEVELGLNGLPSTTSASLAVARAEKTKTRLTERKRTSTFNPGPSDSGVRKSSYLTSNAPWELTCLNHHSLLWISSDNSADITPQRSRDACLEFMLSDYTFMASWDRANCGMIGTWWDFEPGSVICATIIDLKINGNLNSAALILPIRNISRTGTDNEQSAMEQAELDSAIPVESTQREALRGRTFPLRQDLTQSDQGWVFDWMTYQPNQLYYPKAWVQSLGDTPELFKSKQTKDVVLRGGVIRYLDGNGKNALKPPEWTLKTIDKEISPEEVRYLSVFNLLLRDDFTFISESTSYEGPNAVEFRSRNISNGQFRSDNPSDIPELQGQSRLKAYQKTLLTMLGDSLVDLEIRYRILFAERCCQSVVKAFIYMWHPDALDTFDTYFGSSSRFTNTCEEALWTTTITVSHWSFRPTGATEELLKHFEEPRQNGDFPPASVARLGTATNINSKNGTAPLNNIVEERSSSLVITGDAHGFYWTGSIWSSLTDYSSMSIHLNSLPKVLQLFINQQASGRCLVFLILLGHLCERLASEYQVIIKRLDEVVELGEDVLLEGLDWGSNDAPDKLKKMLWGLEALRVFEDRLSSSLSEIQKARESMVRTIQQEPGKRHITLIQEYNNVLEEFGKRYNTLYSVLLRTQLKIKQVAGLRDGISAVTSVDDSRTALKQGNNIRVLTLITIAYLPLGFVAALFATAHDILPSDAGTTLFAILIVIFVVATFSLALSLEHITNFIYQRWENFKGRKNKRSLGNGEDAKRKQRLADGKNNGTEDKFFAARQDELGSEVEKRSGLFRSENISRGSRVPEDLEAGRSG